MKQIEGYPDYYVTEDGRVFSKKFSKLKELSPGKNIKGYKIVCLWDNGNPKMFFVHRLVGQAFIENPLNLPQIDHIDRNRLNNHVSNLRWATPQTNSDNADIAKGESNGMNVQTNEQVLKIKALHKKGFGYVTISKMLDIPQGLCRSAIKHWKHLD